MTRRQYGPRELAGREFFWAYWGGVAILSLLTTSAAVLIWQGGITGRTAWMTVQAVALAYAVTIIRPKKRRPDEQDEDGGAQEDVDLAAVDPDLLAAALAGVFHTVAVEKNTVGGVFEMIADDPTSNTDTKVRCQSAAGAAFAMAGVLQTKAKRMERAVAKPRRVDPRARAVAKAVAAAYTDAAGELAKMEISPNFETPEGLNDALAIREFHQESVRLASQTARWHAEAFALLNRA